MRSLAGSHGSRVSSPVSHDRSSRLGARSASTSANRRVRPARDLADTAPMSRMLVVATTPMMTNTALGERFIAWITPCTPDTCPERAVQWPG